MLIVGELINTSREEIKTAVLNRDRATIMRVAKFQEEAGADYLDVNCGNLVDQEVEAMSWLADTTLEVSKLPLCIDSPNAVALAEGLKKATHAQPMVNSITAETVRWHTVLPLVLEYKAKVVALCIEDAGMPKSLDDRLRIADGLVSRLTGAGVPMGDIYIDPLVTPVSTNQNNGNVVMDAVRKIMESYPGVHTICGLSNVSYGLPGRKELNRLFMVLTMGAGMDAYILNPIDRGMAGSLKGAQALLGKDKFCRGYATAWRAGLYA